MTRDVFLCHASEDKQDVVRPLHNALTAAGISCWLDEAEIHWGDSIIDKVNSGLGDSLFVIVVLSSTFLSKPWPRRELACALSFESSSGVVRVLPLLVGGQRERQAILSQVPLLGDKLYLTWEGDSTHVVKAMQRRIDAHKKEPRRGGGNMVQTVGTRRSYCRRCGAKTGSSSICTGMYTHHEFVQGTGEEFCRRCGAKTGSPTICTGIYTHHEFV